jgi:hypothetical protein
MSWFVRSLVPGDVHRGVVNEGSVRAACGLEFFSVPQHHPLPKEHPMTVTVCLPATEVISIDAMASVDTVLWRCRLCDHHGTTITGP